MAATLVAPVTPGPSRRPGAADPDPAWLVSDAELDALGRLRAEGAWHVAGQDLRLTNLDKVLFPPREGVDEAPVTKRELIAYFARIAPVMLPHLADRPLNLQRFPNGSGAPGFWQKDIPSSAPAGSPSGARPASASARTAPRTTTSSRIGRPPCAGSATRPPSRSTPGRRCSTTRGRPPSRSSTSTPAPSTTWAETLTLARLFRTALEHLGVRAYPKLTGSRGIQAWIPIERGRYTFAETSAWIEKLSRAIGATVPDLVSWEWAKADRGGRARLDYTQNAPIKTLVAPYAVRPRPGRTRVSADPLGGAGRAGPGADRWTIRTVGERVAAIGDPWAGLQDDHQVLPPL